VLFGIPSGASRIWNARWISPISLVIHRAGISRMRTLLRAEILAGDDADFAQPAAPLH